MSNLVKNSFGVATTEKKGPAKEESKPVTGVQHAKNVISTGFGDKDIILGLTKPSIYFNCNTYDKKLMDKSSYRFWNQILVHHETKYRRVDILRQFMKYFYDGPFQPVAYQSGEQTDSFLIRLNSEEMDRLFSNQLKIIMQDGRLCFLTVKFNVAAYEEGQISAERRINIVLDEQIARAEKIRQYKVINLNSFSEKPILKAIHINFANESSFAMVCNALAKYPKIQGSVTGVKFQSNCIKSLKPLEALKNLKLEYLDLSINEVDTIDQLKYLKVLNIKELNLFDNPVKGLRNFSTEIGNYIPSLLIADGRKLEVKETHSLTSKQSGDVVKSHNLNEKFNLSIYRTSTKWHQICIEHNGKSNREEILDAIFSLVVDREFFPCYYNSSPKQDTFFVRSCLDAIDSLCKNRLQLNMKDNVVIPITLILNAKSFTPGELDPGSIILETIGERFNFVDKSLNLENFGVSQQMENVIVNPSNSKVLGMILVLASRRFATQINHISLRNNNIRTGNGLKLLSIIKSLKSLDLGCNKIKELDDLVEGLCKVKIAELTLDGNPLCSNFENGFYYIKRLKLVFPDLEKLDGYTIMDKSFYDIVLYFNQNYICDLNYMDFIENFVQNYFKLYDSAQRSYVEQYYHPNALFSMSLNYEPSKITIANSNRINRYCVRSRNILKVSNLLQSNVNLLVGTSEIIDYYSELPTSEHDYYTFSIDLTIANENMICFTINGMFKELGTSLLENEIWLGFVRTFIMKPYSKNLGVLKGAIEYKIYNEQISIFNLSIFQIKAGFLSKKAIIKEEKNPVLTDFEKQSLVKMFMEITNLKANFSTKCLAKSNWNLRTALENFSRLHELNKIPQIGFIN